MANISGGLEDDFKKIAQDQQIEYLKDLIMANINKEVYYYPTQGIHISHFNQIQKFIPNLEEEQGQVSKKPGDSKPLDYGEEYVKAAQINAAREKMAWLEKYGSLEEAITGKPSKGWFKQFYDHSCALQASLLWLKVRLFKNPYQRLNAAPAELLLWLSAEAVNDAEAKEIEAAQKRDEKNNAWCIYEHEKSYSRRSHEKCSAYLLNSLSDSALQWIDPAVLENMEGMEFKKLDDRVMTIFSENSRTGHVFSPKLWNRLEKFREQQEYNIGFNLTPEQVFKLRKSGADEETIRLV